MLAPGLKSYLLPNRIFHVLEHLLNLVSMRCKRSVQCSFGKHTHVLLLSWQLSFFSTM